MYTDYTTHSSDLLAHEAHNKVGQAIGEYHAADKALMGRPIAYTAYRDNANAILHDVQCTLFELKSRPPLSGAKKTPALEWSGAAWVALAMGLVVGLAVARWR